MTEADRATADELIIALEKLEGYQVLKFSVCTVPGRNGYTWGRCISDSEATIRLLCRLFNKRRVILAALKSLVASVESDA